MATGLRIHNTTVSGTALESSLSSPDVRALVFQGALSQAPAKVLTAVASAGRGDQLGPNEWVQATTSTLGLNNTAGGTGINIGSGYTGAKFYQSLFNLQSTDERRILRLHLASTSATTLSLKTGDSSSVGLGVQVDGALISDSAVLFDPANGPTGAQAGNAPGLERIVVVTPTDLSVSAPQINFNILSGSL